jgi:hypothetical protein
MGPVAPGTACVNGVIDTYDRECEHLDCDFVHGWDGLIFNGEITWTR